MTDEQYIEFLETEIDYLEKWTNDRRIAYNRAKTMREPSGEYLYLVKWLKRLKNEYRGFYPNG